MQLRNSVVPEIPLHIEHVSVAVSDCIQKFAEFYAHFILDARSNQRIALPKHEPNVNKEYCSLNGLLINLHECVINLNSSCSKYFAQLKDSNMHQGVLDLEN